MFLSIKVFPTEEIMCNDKYQEIYIYTICDAPEFLLWNNEKGKTKCVVFSVLGYVMYVPRTWFENR